MRSPAVLALVLAAVSAASAQEFPGVGDLLGQISGVRARTQAQRTIPQAPQLVRAMGTAGRFTTEAFEIAAVPNVSTYTVRGIDISHHQFTIDWPLVKTAGIAFAYIKATEGGDGVDEDFAENWAGARDAGLARGAYHFYNFCKTASEQAANFIKTVPADADALPATIDLEASADCPTMPAKAAFRKDLAGFVAKIRAVYGHAPILYVNYAVYDKYFKGEKDPYKFWIADTNHTAPAMPSWTMWQYGWHGQVAGVPDEVDLDVFNGTAEELAALSGPNGVMVAQP